MDLILTMKRFIKTQMFSSYWAIQDLNLGPHPYQGCALTN